MHYTVRETLRGVCKLQLKVDNKLIPFRQPKQNDYVSRDLKIFLYLFSEPHNNTRDLENSRKCRQGGGGGEADINYRVPSVWKGARFLLCCICFCLSRWYHYLSIVQINPFRPRPSHSATERHSERVSVKIFSLSAPAGGEWGGPLSAVLTSDPFAQCVIIIAVNHN
jgi:hypothetical protein